MMPPIADVRELVVPIVASKLRGVPACEREDVCQEAWIECWQQLSKRPIDDWRAYCAQVARNCTQEYFRRKERETRRFRPADPDDFETAQVESDDPGPELDWVIYLILAWFNEHRSACADIALRRYFDGLSWKDVADRLGTRTEAAKKQWERCREFLMRSVGDEICRILDRRFGPGGVG
jgi:RNA polymerase sigma factor (sigma-70 family)